MFVKCKVSSQTAFTFSISTVQILKKNVRSFKNYKEIDRLRFDVIFINFDEMEINAKRDNDFACLRW